MGHGTVNFRAQYRTIRKRSHCRDNAEFDALARAVLVKSGLDPEHAHGEQWVKASKLVLVPCRRCAGTGQFITGMLNGKPTGPGGICFRCEGKGARNDADERRNYGYDMHAFQRECRAMMG
jgi:hypothetical protein